MMNLEKASKLTPAEKFALVTKRMLDFADEYDLPEDFTEDLHSCTALINQAIVELDSEFKRKHTKVVGLQRRVGNQRKEVARLQDVIKDLEDHMMGLEEDAYKYRDLLK